MKILITGLGSIGRRHLVNLHSLGFTDLHVLTQARCKLPLNDLPPFKTETDLEEALQHKPDAVFVCNPSSLHLETALAAARQHCHIFIEKPLSHTLEGLDELRDLAEKNKLIIQTGFQFRFHGVFQKMKTAIDAGKIGTVVSAFAFYGEYLPDWHPWEDYRQSYSARSELGGGPILTLCHPLDYLRWLIGEVSQVAAIGGKQSRLEIDTEDNAIISLSFENGAVGAVCLDYISKPTRHSLIITGTEGSISWEATCQDAKIYCQDGRSFQIIQPGPFLDRNEMFRAETAHFMHCLQHQQQPACTLHDGIRALQIALLAKDAVLNSKHI